MSPILNLLALHAVYLLACGGVIAAVVCRLDEMNRKRNKLGWFLMYVAYGAYALAVLIDGMVSHQWNKAYLLGLLAMALNLGLTMKNWRTGPPPLSCRPPPCGEG